MIKHLNSCRKEKFDLVFFLLYHIKFNRLLVSEPKQTSELLVYWSYVYIFFFHPVETISIIQTSQLLVKAFMRLYLMSRQRTLSCLTRRDKGRGRGGLQGFGDKYKYIVVYGVVTTVETWSKMEIMTQKKLNGSKKNWTTNETTPIR